MTQDGERAANDDGKSPRRLVACPDRYQPQLWPLFCCVSQAFSGAK